MIVQSDLLTKVGGSITDHDTLQVNGVLAGRYKLLVLVVHLRSEDGQVSTLRT